MTVAIFVALVIGLLLLRVNVVLVLAVATAYVHLYFASGSELAFLAQDLWFAIDREVLLSIPMFMIAGAVMTRGTIAARLIRVMSALTAPIPGGLAIAAVLSCAVFAAISGSSIVTMLAVGSIMYPALIKEGYGRNFSLGLMCSAGTLGIIIPPSIPMILYGIMTETSITDLFIAGVVPGMLLTFLFCAYALAVNRMKTVRAWDLQEIASSVRHGIWALLMPIILLGGIYTGYYTPTEAAAVSLVYALIVELFIHREMKPREYITVVFETTKLLGTLLPLLAIAGSLNTILDYEGVPKAWAEMVSQVVTDPGAQLAGINILLLVVGCIMDIGSAILILAPLLMPMVHSIGLDPVHFGVVMIMNLEIGYLTPPVGINLFIAMVAFKESFGRIVVSVLPFIALMLFALVLVILIPEIALYAVQAMR
ncbi:MAG: TRAP transporter large permease [Pseudomonadota bacterium]|nr:TRAP transporter large permease [Pseudomonadota bacterium]